MPCLALAAGVALGSLPAVAQTRKIVLGYELPLSGDSSHYGEVFRNAADLMLEDFKSSGGLPGTDIVIRYEDSKNDARRHAISPRCSSTTNPWLACWATSPAPSRWQSVKSMPRPACPSCHRQPPTPTSSRSANGSFATSRRRPTRAPSTPPGCESKVMPRSLSSDPERLGPLGGREFRQRLQGERRQHHLDRVLQSGDARLPLDPDQDQPCGT